jgi:hypothetical protein
MSTNLFLEYAMIAEACCAWALLGVLLWKKLAHSFSFVAAYAAALGLDISVRVLLLYFHRQIGLSPKMTYASYFYSCWSLALIEHMLMLFIIYQVFRSAMSPFKGLRRLGTMVFKWVCSVAAVLTIGTVVVPGHVTLERYLTIIGQFEQSIGILTVCVLLFVCFSIRYLGMTYRSHLFGISLGLGMMGSIDLALSAWASTHGVPGLYSQLYVLQALSGTLTLLVWGGYFLQPEQRRELVLLPTTSPYFVWNEISAALGDHPGVVAVSGFTPDSLSPAERMVLGAAPRRDEARSSVATKVRVSVAEQATATGTQR